jgi:hypothetical protein
MTKSENDKTNLKIAKIKEIGAVLAIVSSLVLGTLGYLKEGNESIAKAGYKELASQIEKDSKERLQLQKDIAAIRGYLAAKAEQDDKVFSLAQSDAELAKSIAKRKEAGSKVSVPVLRPLQFINNQNVIAAAPAITQPAAAEQLVPIPLPRSDAKEYKAKTIEQIAASAQTAP